jgi:ribosomal-protein-alanine N-acetyltransferase
VTINIEITSSPDTAALSEIHRASFSAGWNANAIEELLAVAGTVAFVMPENNGFALLRQLGEEAEILTLAVNLSLRRKGMAKRLMDALLIYAHGQGVKRIFLEVRQSNNAALALYGQYGFTVLSRRKNYYHNSDGSSEDAIIMHYQR